jgi:hypothetical protein
MIINAKVALCMATLLGTSSATWAESTNRQRSAESSSTYGQAPSQDLQGARAGNCWIPARGGAGFWREDSRGFGYWGSCSEPHARPMK